MANTEISFYPEKLKPFFQAMRTRRVDLFHIGDSNELFNGVGRNHGYQSALSQFAPMYATGAVSFRENNGAGSNTGWKYVAANNGARPGANSGASTYYDSRLTAVGSLNNQLQYQNDATDDSSNTGIVLLAGVNLDVNAALRYHYSWGNFSTGTGAFQPQVRLGESPFTQYVLASNQVTGSGTDNLILYASVDVPASTGRENKNMDFRLCAGGGPTVAGPGVWFYNRVEQVNRTAGWAVTPMFAQGGVGLRTFNNGIAGSPNTIPELFKFGCRIQNGDPMACVIINSGLNDRADATASTGPVGGLASNTRAGWLDNLNGIMNRVTEAWNINGYNTGNLFFLLWPSAPISVPDDANLLIYRQACRDMAENRQNVAVIDTGAAAPTIVGNRAAYFAVGGTDTAHMTDPGYEAYCSMGWQDFIPAALKG